MKSFDIQTLIGTGHTAEVFLATDPNRDVVALKVPLPDTPIHSEAMLRFLSETRTHLKMQHPFVVRVLGGSASGEKPYLALEYFPDGSLDKYLNKRGKLLPVEALSYIYRITAALDYVHGQGVLHQDVKSANIYWKNYEVFLGDFGMAVSASQPRFVAGSPFYMAPETYKGENSTVGTDVYSLGILAYEMLTGKRPFEGESYQELMIKHLTQYPQPILHFSPDLPRAAASMITRLMAKDPKDRPTTEQILHVLQTTLPELGVEVPLIVDLKEVERTDPSSPPKLLGRHTRNTAPSKPAVSLSDLNKLNKPSSPRVPEQKKSNLLDRLLGKKKP